VSNGGEFPATFWSVPEFDVFFAKPFFSRIWKNEFNFTSNRVTLINVSGGEFSATFWSVPEFDVFFAKPFFSRILKKIILFYVKLRKHSTKWRRPANSWQLSGAIWNLKNLPKKPQIAIFFAVLAVSTECSAVSNDHFVVIFF
jgi:hypothetical protein